jgi:hypothetical protein
MNTEKLRTQKSKTAGRKYNDKNTTQEGSKSIT